MACFVSAKVIANRLKTRRTRRLHNYFGYVMPLPQNDRTLSRMDSYLRVHVAVFEAVWVYAYASGNTRRGTWHQMEPSKTLIVIENAIKNHGANVWDNSLKPFNSIILEALKIDSPMHSMNPETFFIQYIIDGMNSTRNILSSCFQRNHLDVSPD